jgi:DNA-binding CsgD family transcriptional regulator
LLEKRIGTSLPAKIRAVTSRWPLVGRTEELALIADATRAIADRARGIVLSGAAGVGKTRIAHEAVATCGRRSARRHWIVGTATARSVPLGAFADVATDFGPDPLRRVREVIDGLIGDADDGEVVLGVDDAHLLDDLSAFTVHQIVTRRLATVILTIRSGERPPDAITAIWKDQHLDRLELQPLSLDETTLLLEHVLDGPVHSVCARRLWQYTQGNTLYLRHLLDSEVNAGHISRSSGIWLWEGQPKLPPTLAELIDARIARAPRAVRDVLDALAVTEPLDIDILAAFADRDAIAEAESLGLVRIDADVLPAAVRLAHPMFGEVRRSSSVRLQRLAGRIATELARKGSTDPRDVVRRAVLTLESDVVPSAELLLAAAGAAMQLMDLRLAETLAERAVAAGGGPDATITQAMAITWQERGMDAEHILAGLAGATTEPVRSQVAMLRALNLAASLGQPAGAERELEAVGTDDGEAQASAAALRALIAVTRGDARTAVVRAAALLADPPDDAVAQMISIWALVTGLGDLGRIDEIEPVAERGYVLADSSPEASHLRHPLAVLQAHAYRLAGALTQADAVIARIRRDTFDVPFEGTWHAFLASFAALCRGALTDTQRLCQESVAFLDGGSGGMIKGFSRTWMATATAMAGNAVDARREFAAIEWWDQDPDACEWDSERAIAQAWTHAAEGSTSQAISICLEAAVRERRLGRPAVEVCLLQAATQFGDATTASRLAELADQVQGPRAPTAAAHASALTAASGVGLVDVSRRYEQFGDRGAAADAAAPAVLAYQHAGLRGAGLTSWATAQRLAAECQGARTPALRMATAPQSFTARQREIISLAAQGLSNKQIADRLAMSVRSIEGHLFRASQRVGANSRDQLISLLQDC